MEDGYYEIGIATGKSESRYTVGQFELSLSFIISEQDVPNKTITLRESIFYSSLGREKQICNSRNNVLQTGVNANVEKHYTAPIVINLA